MTTITESTPFGVAAAPAEGPGRFTIQIMTPGWGSSGYYSAEVGEAAARDRVFPAGTHMYVDHPSATEAYDRPERTVKDLAAVTTTDAVWDGTRLSAEAVVFSSWRHQLAEMADHIGVSLRGAAEVTHGEAEGRSGTIITRLTEGSSIDFVTKAGRGGKVLAVLESHKAPVEEARNVGQWLEARIHQSFTNTTDELFGDGRLTREERISLSSAIGDALGSFVTNLQAAAPQLYSRDLWEDPGATTVATEKQDPVVPAGKATESEEDTMPQIEEARLRTLEADASRATVLENEKTEAVKRAEVAEAKAAKAIAESNKIIARGVVQEAFSAAGVTAPKTVARLAESAPVDEDGAVDTDALKTYAEESASELAEASGAGTPRGMSGDASASLTESGDEDMSDAELREALTSQKEA